VHAGELPGQRGAQLLAAAVEPGDVRIRMASALTKPVMTERGTKRMSFGTPRRPRTTCTTPAAIVAAIRYSTPWSRT
jgi:hypothetical protein